MDVDYKSTLLPAFSLNNPSTDILTNKIYNQPELNRIFPNRTLRASFNFLIIYDVNGELHIITSAAMTP